MARETHLVSTIWGTTKARENKFYCNLPDCEVPREAVLPRFGGLRRSVINYPDLGTRKVREKRFDTDLMTTKVREKHFDPDLGTRRSARYNFTCLGGTTKVREKQFCPDLGDYVGP